MLIIGIYGDGSIAALSPEEVIKKLSHLRDGARDPRLGSNASLSLIETARQEVVAVLDAVLCPLHRGGIAYTPVIAWTQVEDIADEGGLAMLDALSGPICDLAPMAAAVVTAWRGLAHAILAHHDGDASRRMVTGRAEQTIQLARWISGGGFAHAMGID